MRTLGDIIQASRMGEECTEQELRCALRCLDLYVSLAARYLGKWWVIEPSALMPQMKIHTYFKRVRRAMNTPVDKILGPSNMPGNYERTVGK